MALSRRDWIDAATRAIAEGGIGAVAVEPLAAALGATKGSFYWHFKNRDDLIRATLAAWESEGTDALIEALSGVADPAERLDRLLRAAMRDGSEVGAADLALLAAASHPLAAPVVARVQRKRMAFLEAAFAELGLAPVAARHRARLAYSAYLGWYQQRLGQPEAAFGPREEAAYRRTVIELITAR